jgi:hypothetical protein
MKNRIIKFVICITILSGCNQPGTNHNVPKTDSLSENNSIKDSLAPDKNDDYKVIDLKFGFKVKIGEEEDFQDFKTYSYFELTKDNRVIYFGDSEYQFDNELYPIVIKTGTDSYELLFEINDRPTRNYLKRLFIENNKVVKQDKLPTFVAPPKDINGDGILEYAGYWDYAQTWGENCSLTAYNPILYYSITPTGLKLDSALTAERNEKIYGIFRGFHFSEDSVQSISVMSKFNGEIDNIIRKK